MPCALAARSDDVVAARARRASGLWTLKRAAGLVVVRAPSPYVWLQLWLQSNRLRDGHKSLLAIGLADEGSGKWTTSASSSG